MNPKRPRFHHFPAAEASMGLHPHFWRRPRRLSQPPPSPGPPSPPSLAAPPRPQFPCCDGATASTASAGPGPTWPDPDRQVGGTGGAMCCAESLNTLSIQKLCAAHNSRSSRIQRKPPPGMLMLRFFSTDAVTAVTGTRKLRRPARTRQTVPLADRWWKFSEMILPLSTHRAGSAGS